MSNWKQSKYEAGTEVLVMDIHFQYLGVGILLYDYDQHSDDNPHPEIRMPDSTILLGCECWWIPVNEVEPEYRPGGSKWRHNTNQTPS